MPRSDKPAADIDGTYFPYERDNRWKVLFALLGMSDRDGVVVTDETFVATFGRKRVETPLVNIDDTQVTGPHRWYTAVGLRLSFSDDGLTFGTNHRAGLHVAFVEKVPRVFGFRDHSALWVSVADPAGLAAALAS